MLLFYFLYILKKFVNCVCRGVPVRDYCCESCLLALGIDRPSTTPSLHIQFIFFCGLRRQSVVCKFELQSVVHGTGEAYTPETAMLGDEPSSSCLLMEHRPHNRLHVPCKRLLLSQLRSSLITQNKQLRHELHAKTNKVHSERLQVFHHI